MTYYCFAPPEGYTFPPDITMDRLGATPECGREFPTEAARDAHQAADHPIHCVNRARPRAARPAPVDRIPGPSVDRPEGKGGGPARSQPPTARQLAYLEALAARKGQPVPKVGSKRAASEAIDRLAALPDVRPHLPNRYAGPCSDCGHTVEAGAGMVRKVEGRWLVGHTGGCPSDPVPEQPWDVPDGRYAITAEAGHTSFYRVKRGRKPGVVFVDLIVGGQGPQPVPHRQRASILARIAADGPTEAGYRYGREIGRCCACGRTLTNEASRAAGIGPECAGRWG